MPCKCFGTGLEKQGPKAKYGPPTAFINEVLLEHSSFIYILSIAAFILQWQIGVVTTETVIHNPKIFTIWPITEKVCQHLP